ncbi:3 exoribonuclease domain 1 domain-containing protein [Cystoisospora suis]|uniref:3 exoribonuclease domain 1 domain-containing protein n=1 Tax=Cystoisospora suis TaxID=483139 RepID=A0A2C6LBA8_9APIC|nr:3 exoribonuclease domain 1 domain-containing protein [Cystoisospora suis]
MPRQLCYRTGALAVALSANAPSAPPLPYEVCGRHERLCEAAGARRRHDGRAFEEMRSMCMQANSLTGAAGSAFVSVGKTKINCAVYGPRPNRRPGASQGGRINLEFNYAPFSRERSELLDDANPHLMTQLHQALNAVVRLERYLKSTIDVCVLVVEDDGAITWRKFLSLVSAAAGVLSAALTCIGLALAVAGIEVIDILTGASAESRAFSNNKEWTQLDLGYCPGLASVCFVNARGPLVSGYNGEQLFALCEAACYAVADEVRSCLRKAFASKYQGRALGEEPASPHISSDQLAGDDQAKDV